MSRDPKISRKRKSVSWQTDDKIKKIHLFESEPDERINVSKQPVPDQANSAPGNSTIVIDPFRRSNGSIAVNTIIGSSSKPGRDRSDNRCIEHFWGPLIAIDFTPDLPQPGWNSIERGYQAEREAGVLGAIDLPGQPSLLGEPDPVPKPSSLSTSTTSAPLSSQPQSVPVSTANGSPEEETFNNSVTNEIVSKESFSNVKIIPLENPEGTNTEYSDMYNSIVVNGVKLPSDDPTPTAHNFASFCNQQSQMIPNQFQIQATQVPYIYPDLGTRFQQSAQMPIPFQPQPQLVPQQQIHGFQQPFTNQPLIQAPQAAVQQQLPHQLQPSTQFLNQQAGLTGPITPWISYPFNQIGESSHAHLFRGPTT